MNFNSFIPEDRRLSSLYDVPVDCKFSVLHRGIPYGNVTMTGTLGHQDTIHLARFLADQPGYSLTSIQEEIVAPWGEEGIGVTNLNVAQMSKYLAGWEGYDYPRATDYTNNYQYISRERVFRGFALCVSATTVKIKIYAFLPNLSKGDNPFIFDSSNPTRVWYKNYSLPSRETLIFYQEGETREAGESPITFINLAYPSELDGGHLITSYAEFNKNPVTEIYYKDNKLQTEFNTIQLQYPLRGTEEPISIMNGKQIISVRPSISPGSNAVSSGFISKEHNYEVFAAVQPVPSTNGTSIEFISPTYNRDNYTNDDFIWLDCKIGYSSIENIPCQKLDPEWETPTISPMSENN